MTRGGSSSDEGSAAERKTQLPFAISKDTVQGSLEFELQNIPELHKLPIVLLSLSVAIK